MQTAFCYSNIKSKVTFQDNKIKSALVIISKLSRKTTCFISVLNKIALSSSSVTVENHTNGTLNMEMTS